MEENLREVPITIETAHQFFTKRQMRFIVKMFKENYRQGFKHGTQLRKVVAVFLFSICSFGQSSIVSGANKFETFGVGLVELQIEVKKDVPLSVPKYEIPIEKPKQIVKKKLTFWQRILKIFNFK